MRIWEHLFLTGEYSPRARVLSGLTLEQVTVRPDGASHSIYDELWHAAHWQRIVVERDKGAAGALLSGGPNYPASAPVDEREWHSLVQRFLDGAKAAVALAQAPGQLAAEWEPGVTMGDELYSLAVHNAYHLGKIVSLRQRIGAWPPEGTSQNL